MLSTRVLEWLLDKLCELMQKLAILIRKALGIQVEQVFGVIRTVEVMRE